MELKEKAIQLLASEIRRLDDYWCNDGNLEIEDTYEVFMAKNILKFMNDR